MQIERVPTDENIADLPSREDYRLLEQIPAEKIEPAICKEFLDPQSWEALRLKVCLYKGRSVGPDDRLEHTMTKLLCSSCVAIYS